MRKSEVEQVIRRKAFTCVAIWLVAVAMLAISTLASPIQAAFNACEYLPPVSMREQPNKPFRVVQVAQANMKKVCDMEDSNLDVYGCARPNISGLGLNDPKLTDFIIYVAEGVSSGQLECIIAHEKGHLPPNNWDVDHEGKRPDWRKWN